MLALDGVYAGGELLHELKRFKDDVRRSIPPAALEAVRNRPSGSSDSVTAGDVVAST